MLVCRCVIVLNFITNTKCDFLIPNITLEALKYGGFRVYIPDSPSGISWFTFQANVNEDITESDPGKIVGDTRSPMGSYWVINFAYTLKLDDVVNYWVFVSANKFGHRKDDCAWPVKELKDFYAPLNSERIKAQTILNGNKTVCVGDPIIVDHFDGPTMDRSVWIVEHRIPTYSEPTFEFNSYENRNDTCFFKNGKLYLKPIALMNDLDVRGVLDLREGCTSTNPIQCYYAHLSSFLLPPVKSGKITSRVSFKYGRIEIKANLSAGDWIITVMKLEPKDEGSKSAPIWLVYSRGNRHLMSTTKNDIGSCVIYSGEKQITRRAKRPYSDDFHTYSLEWLPGKLAFYFDFEEYAVLNDDFDNAEYVLSLGVAVGGVYDFPDDICSGINSKPWRNDDRNYIKKFFQARNDWLKTWNGDGPALKIDYVKHTVRVLLLCVKAQYIVPDVLVEALSPRGLRVSIPDEEGISLFAFHGKINEEMNGREAGTFSVDILKKKDGRWTYMTKAPKLKIGDKIYYWVNVDFDDGNGKRGYILDDQEFTVTELIPNDTVSTTSTTTTTTTTTTAPPTKATTVKSCRHTPTIVNGERSCKGTLIFEENFASLSHRKWRPEIKFSGNPDYEFVIYQNSTENLYVKKNILHIKPTLTDAVYGSGYVKNSEGLDLGSQCTGIPESSDCYQKPRAWQILPPVISARISTIDRLSFIHASIEIRAKLPKGDWIYPELQLKSRNNAYGAGYDSGEIRIAFLPGNFNQSKTLTGGCILGQSVVARNYGIKNIRSEKHWNHDYHVYRMDWRTDRITLSVDGHVYGNIYPPEDGFANQGNELGIEPDVVERWKTGTKLAPFDKEMYLLLGVGVGGQSFPNRNDDGKPWDNDDPKAQLHFYQNQDVWSSTWNDDSELRVDYVKIWAV